MTRLGLTRTFIKKAQQQCAIMKELVANDHDHQLSIKGVEDMDLLVHYKNKIYTPNLLSIVCIQQYNDTLICPEGPGWKQRLNRVIGNLTCTKRFKAAASIVRCASCLKIRDRRMGNCQKVGTVIYLEPNQRRPSMGTSQHQQQNREIMLCI